uniref:Uncharacterized protein LOC111114789 n=1 Tax=Crassostrea virginica TaxID=6565 RepID=A0A8B8C001_CRAVI|nr:uncharacterized protein LOC111114789 [Crassostrea virginica]XP_022310818.1 uncharacterized protein LOC111116122 [Crassostrea virginica]
MVKGCCVHGCTANSMSNTDRNFYIIPKEAKRRDKWLRAINRAHVNKDGSVDRNRLWSPNSGHVYVCSAHFVSGKKVNDPCHPDFVPSIFPQNEKPSSIKVDRYQRAIKRYNTESETQRTTARKKLKLLDQQSPTNIMQFHSYVKSPDDHDSEHCDKDLSCNKAVQMKTRPVDPSLEKSDHEREMLFDEIENLICEKNEVLERVKILEKLMSVSSLHSDSVEGNDERCKMMTGITWGVFIHLFTFLSTFIKSSSTSKLPPREQLFLTLLKLRHNLTFEFFSHVKGIPKSTIVDYFWKWMDLMHYKLKFFIRWADRDIINKTIPPVFKEKFPRLTSIIDCFEIFIEAPKNLLARAQCYSSYKRHTTIKCFISCNPHGAINFLSKCWGGRASDAEIVRNSGFISSLYHLPGDQILADRGFTLADDFAALCSAELITPSFTRGKKQLSAREVEISRKVSSVRIHIERVIGCLKNRFSILKGTLPIRCVQSLKDESMEESFSSCDKILTVCAALSNMGQSIVFHQ